MRDSNPGCGRGAFTQHGLLCTFTTLAENGGFESRLWAGCFHPTRFALHVHNSGGEWGIRIPAVGGVLSPNTVCSARSQLWRRMGDSNPGCGRGAFTQHGLLCTFTTLAENGGFESRLWAGCFHPTRFALHVHNS